MRTPVAALLLFLALGAATTVEPAHLEAQTPSRPEITSLRFEGNASVPGELLAGAILTRPTTCRFTSILLRPLRPLCWTKAEFAHDRSYLNPREFEDDYQRLLLLYWQRGFREALVDTVVVRTPDNRAAITFQIDEGEAYRIASLEVLGLEELGDPSLEEDLPVSVEDPLNQVLLEMARDTLGQRLRNLGYARVQVLRNVFIPTGSRRAEVEFDVYTGPRARFGRISIVGGPSTGGEELEETVIRRMLPFAEGTVYNRELLFEGQRNLYDMQVLAHASILEDLEHEPDSIVPLTVTVNEGVRHRVRAGGAWNTAECFSAESQWTSFDFFGGARRLVVRARVANVLTHTFEESFCAGAGTEVYGDPNWVVSADFTQPFILSPRNSFTASLFAERQSLQDVFVREALGLNLNLIRSLGRASPLTLSYRPQLARLDAAEIFFCTSVLVCNPLDIDLLQASNRLSPLGLSFFRDRTNRALAPTGGYTLLADTEIAATWTGSDFAYRRALGEVTTFWGFGGEFVLAGRLHGGWLGAGPFKGLTAVGGEGSREVAHPQKRFYAGGSNSVRAYSQNQLGPKVASVRLEDLLFPLVEGEDPACLPDEVVDLTCDASTLGAGAFVARPTGGSRHVEGTVELRFPVWGLNISGATFLDFGQVWDAAAGFTFDRLALGPGIGLRYATPVGPLRIDVAYHGPEISRRPVVTSQLRPYEPGRDAPKDRLQGPGGQVIDWVRIEDLAPLGPRVEFAEGSGSIWNRLQLHVSIGQAF
ncbi:MAG: hypothetical protein EXR92_01515 [Gemmatimonadetes bacterium]|nr:hypothetical protein [Gemmatimonadota bacterium]